MLLLLCKPSNVIDLTTEEKWAKNRNYPMKLYVSGVQTCALTQFVVHALKCCAVLMQLLVSEMVQILR